MRRVQVPLGDRSYNIMIGEGLLPRLGVECRKLAVGRTCAVISDTHVAALYSTAALYSLKRAGFDPILIRVPAGEIAKSLKTVQICYDQLAAHRLERQSLLVALGGGVVGDLAGFVAATYLRGVGFVQVPTTLLAQVDSSVGGKVGVNLNAGKNLVGAFYQPRFVLCDLDALKTLPKREFSAGLAEVIKYGIIYDAGLFKYLEQHLPELLTLQTTVLGRVIARCCEIKSEVVAQDEKEAGLRAILNFGHTIGHAIETISSYSQYLHGEAISVGQVAAAYISTRMLGFPAEAVGRVSSLLARSGLPVHVKFTPAQLDRLLKAMQVDKKVVGGEVKFVLAEKIGKVSWGHKVPQELIRESLAPLPTNKPGRHP